jgi:phosphate transport system substrate-binding protein
VQSKNKRWLAWLALPLSLSLLAAACGGDDDDDASTGDDTGSGSSEEASGTVNISGSSTVGPISTLAGELFQEENPDASVNVETPGTGDGFKLFCDGETDISDASRQIKDEEKATCDANGIEYVEIKIAFDGLTVMTNPNNDSVECLSFADLYALIGPEAEGFKKWSDGSSLATQLGSTTQLPDEDLDLTGPGTESGTYDSFIELALAKIAEGRGQPDDATRTDYKASPDDNVIISNIEASDGSLGWVGFAYAEEAGDEVKEVKIAKEPGGDCVAPDADTIASGDYPLSRSLYIYVNKAKAESNAAVVPFVDFYLANLTDVVEEAGYIALPSDQADESVAAWDAR